MSVGILSLAGNSVDYLTLYVCSVGPWSAALHMSEAPALADLPSGVTELVINGETLRGTVDPLRSGAYLTDADVTVVGGANGWQRSVPAKAYHNDAFVGLRAPLETTAAEVGETLATTTAARLPGVDYVRYAGSASRVLHELAPAWYVDYDGLTYTEVRLPSEPSAAVELQAFDARTACGVFKLNVPSDLRIGAVLTAAAFKLPGDRVVRALDIRITRKEIRAHAWLPLAS